MHVWVGGWASGWVGGRCRGAKLGLAAGVLLLGASPVKAIRGALLVSRCFVAPAVAHLDGALLFSVVTCNVREWWLRTGLLIVDEGSTLV